MKGLTLDFELHLENYNSTAKTLTLVLLFTSFSPGDVDPLGVSAIMLKNLQDTYAVLISKSIAIQISSGTFLTDVDDVSVEILEDYILDYALPEGIHVASLDPLPVVVYNKIVLHYREKTTTSPTPPPAPGAPYYYEEMPFVGGDGTWWIPDMAYLPGGDVGIGLFNQKWPWVFPDGTETIIEVHPQALGMILSQTKETLELYKEYVPTDTWRAFLNAITGYLPWKESETFSSVDYCYGLSSAAEWDDFIEALMEGTSFPNALAPRPGFWYSVLSTENKALFAWGEVEPNWFSMAVKGKEFPSDFKYIYEEGPKAGGIPALIGGLGLLGLLHNGIRIVEGFGIRLVSEEEE